MQIFYKYILIAAVLFSSFMLFFFPKWTVDDAYITYRYAHNLSENYELNWNPGENPVEGYTGIMLPVIIAVFIKIGISPVLASQLLGVISFILGGITFYFLLNNFKIRKIITSLILLLYCTAPFLYTHIFSGLETIPFSTILIVCIFFLFQYLNTYSFGILRKLLIGLLILSLTRPEGIVLSLVSIFFIFTEVYTGKNYKKLIINITLFLILPLLIYFLWRWNYYGQPLPNTYYIKSTDKFSFANLKAFSTFFSYYFYLPLFCGLLLICFNLRDLYESLKKNSFNFLTRQFIITFTTSVLFVAIVLVQYLRSNLLTNYSYRFFVPFYPIMLIGIAVLMEAGLSNFINFSNKKSIKYVLSIIILFSFTLLQIYSHVNQMKYEVSFANSYKTLIEKEHIEAGKYLKRNLPISEWTVVCIDAGAIPYYSERKTIDFGGLNDEFITNSITIKKQNKIKDYIYSHNPGAFIFTTSGIYNLHVSGNTLEIIKDYRFKNYRLVKKFFGNLNNRDYSQFIYFRKDLAANL